MSFQIFASGTTIRDPHFQYRRSGLDVGDIYEAVEGIAGIATLPQAGRVWREGVRAGARALAIDQAQSQATATSAQQRANEASARLIAVNNLENNLNGLLMTRVPLILFIAVRASGSGSNVNLRFDTSETNAPARLMRHLNPVLSAANMNGFGVINALAIVFREYDAVAGVGADGLFRLLVQIDG